MELIGKISKGSKMDQVYIPKNRDGFPVGQPVLVISLEEKIKARKKIKPYFYGIKKIEPIKLRIIEEIFSLLKIESENIIIAGSFLEPGFGFNDIDILIISENKIDLGKEKGKIESLGIKPHLIILNSKTLISGLSSDPLYNMMLSKCIARKRIIYNVKRKLNYKLLDLHLLKSKSLTDNFDILNGNEKYYLTLNLISILLFIRGKRVSKDAVNKEIEKMFNIKINRIKENLLDKKLFLGKYKQIYDKTFKIILKNIKNPENLNFLAR